MEPGGGMVKLNSEAREEIGDCLVGTVRIRLVLSVVSSTRDCGLMSFAMSVCFYKASENLSRAWC